MTKLLLSAIAGLALTFASSMAVAAATGAAYGGLANVEGRVSLWPIPNPATPRDPVAAPDGTIYFAQAGSDRIVRFDPGTAQYREWPVPAGTKPHGVAVLADRKLVFGGNGNGILGQLDPATGSIRRFPLADGASRPYSIALGADGSVWATERAGRIARLRPGPGTIEEYPMDGEPYDIVVDPQGAVWVTRLAADRVTRFDPATGKSTDVVLAPGAKPRRIDIGPDGSIWVTLYGSGRLAKIDAASARVAREFPLPGGGNAGPYSVNPDARGRVWVTEFQTDSVAILDPATEKFRVIRLPERNCGVRNATIDRNGRFWFVCSTSGMLGVIE